MGTSVMSRQHASSERPIVMVTDAEERSSLAACRGLTRAGYRVIGTARMQPASGHWSRSCWRRITLPDPREDAEGFLTRIEEAVRRERPVILLPSPDPATWLIPEHRERFDGLALLPFSDREAVRASLDKVRLIEAARSADLAAPFSVVCVTADEGVAAATEIGFPVVVKAARS